MAQKRMSPMNQSNMRAEYESELKNAMTGDADVDSMMAKEVRRRFTFGAGERGKPAPAAPDTSSIGYKIKKFFARKPKEKK